jgi:fatty acid-binding protein DegV
MIEERISPKSIRIAEVGSIISCHAGLGVFGLYFRHK